MCVCPPHVPLLWLLWNSDWNSPPAPPPAPSLPACQTPSDTPTGCCKHSLLFFSHFIWICVLISSVVLPIECMLLTAVFSSCLKTGLFCFDVSLAAPSLPPAPSSLWPMRSVSRRYSLSSILYLVKLVFSESTVGGAGGLMFWFVLFCFPPFFVCVSCWLCLLLSSTHARATPDVCVHCVAALLSLGGIWDIWYEALAVLYCLIQWGNCSFCHFVLCSLPWLLFHFLSICIVLFSIFLGDRYFFIYIFCDFYLFVCFVCFIHQSRLIRSCYILFIKQQAFGK